MDLQSYNKKIKKNSPLERGQGVCLQNLLRRVFSLLIVNCSLLILVASCSKDQPVRVNPYSTVDYSVNNPTTTPVDSTSILGIHKNILITKCSKPGCHDGTFEPDFRTVQSSYSTLVYQPVKKSTVDSVNFFTTRVIPYDTLHSFIHERLTTTTTDYMPSNAVRLEPWEIQNINKWIMNGAKIPDGSIPPVPDRMPTIIGFAAFDSALARLDTNRGGVGYNPFMLNGNSTVNIYLSCSDDSTPIQNFSHHKMLCSYNKDNFSAATTFNGTYIFLPPNYQLWMFSFNTNQFTTSVPVYMRFYVNDGHQISDVEVPTDISSFYVKGYYSFKVN